MADESRNPADNAQMRRLERDLRGLVGSLRADLQEGRALRDQAAQEKTRTEKKAQEESRTRKARTGGRIAAEEPAAVRASATEAERLAQARERGAKAAKATEQSERATAQQLRAQRLLPRAGGTTGGFQGGLTPAEVRARAEIGGLQTGGARGPGGGLPPRPPAPPAPAAPGGGEPPRDLRTVINGYRRAAAEARGLGVEESATAQRARVLAAETGRLNQELQRSSRVVGLSSQSFQKHGYLTSEFINAARKGQVTFRELGEQVGGTISKFGGWTIAAASVYAALGAVSALGRGAVESNRGVNQLSRVITSGFNTDEAQRSFRKLAHEMNLPMSDVVDAAYGMAKVFNNQNDALAATEQALFAVKVGELDAGTATRYLTAIVAGFGLEVDQLGPVLDAVNQAQNRFGGNVGQITAGVSKAAGAFRLAGGNYKELIALIVSGTRLTGTTGENVGTAISRSASNVLTPQGQKRLRAAGLDPQQDYPALLAQAMKESQGASKERVEEIARAMVPAGGQFARVFVPLLQNVQLYKKVLKEVQPEEAFGSAQRELRKTLRSVGEQMKAVINNIEQLGAGFGQAGGLDVLVGGVYALNQMLHLSTQLLEVFNELPKPVRHAAMVMLQLYGVTRLMRRFDVGSSIPVGRNGAGQGFADMFRRAPHQQQRALIMSGLGAEEKDLADRNEQLARQASFAKYQSVRAAERHAALLNSGVADEDKINRSAALVVAREEEAARLAADQADTASRLATVRRQEKAFGARKLRNEQAVIQAARDEGIAYAPPTLEQKSAMAPVFLGNRAAIDDGAATRTAVTRAERTTAALRRATEQTRGFAQRLGPLTSGGARAFGLLASGTQQVTRGVVGFGRGLKSFATSVAASLGPLEVALIGLITAQQTYSYVTGRLDAASSKAEALASTAGGPDSIRGRAEQELHQKSLMDRAQGAFATGFNFFAPAGQRRIEAPDQIEDRQARAAKSLANNIEGAQQKGALLYLPEIQARVTRRVNGARTAADKIKGIEQGLVELGQSWARVYGGKEAKAAAQETEDAFKAQISDIQAAGHSLSSIMDSIKNVSQLTAFVGRLQNRVALEGPTPLNAKRAGAAAAKARQLAATAKPDEAAKILQQGEAASNAVLQAAETKLNNLLAVSRGPREAAGARRDYLQTVRSALGIDAQHNKIDELAKTTRRRASQIAQLEREVNGQTPKGLGKVRGLVPLQQLGIPGLDLGAATDTGVRVTAAEAAKSKKLAALKKKQDQDASDLRALRKSMGITDAQWKAIEQAQRKAQSDAALAAFDTHTSLLQAQTADPLAQARILAQRMHERTARVREAYRKHLATTDELEAQLARESESQMQLVQQNITNFQSRQALGASQFALSHTNQGAVLGHAVSDAKAFAQFLRSQGNKVDPNAYRDSLARVADAQKALADYVRQQAEGMVSARAELALAGTDDPVKQAEIRAREAQDLIKFATDPVERMKRSATAKRARRDLPTVKAQAKFDDIEFQRDIEQISAQTEYAMLSSLLKTKGITQEFRRNVMRRMHQVKKDMENDSAGFDMNVGDIKLPTVYEIRRAIKGASRGGPQYTVQNNNKIELVVADGADVDEVFERVDQITGSSLKATARSAGVR